MAVQFAELDKVTNICNCYIFATILSKEDTNNDFSLQVEYINNYAPILKIQRFNLKECQEYPKIGWIVVGKPINFDFDKTEFPININNNFNHDVASFNTCQLMAPTSQSDSTIAVKANFNLKRQICHYVYEITDKNTPVNNDDVHQQSVPFCYVDTDNIDNDQKCDFLYNTIDTINGQKCNFDQMIANWQKNIRCQNFIILVNNEALC